MRVDLEADADRCEDRCLDLDSRFLDFGVVWESRDEEVARDSFRGVAVEDLLGLVAVEDLLVLPLPLLGVRRLLLLPRAREEALLRPLLLESAPGVENPSLASPAAVLLDRKPEVASRKDASSSKLVTESEEKDLLRSGFDFRSASSLAEDERERWRRSFRSTEERRRRLFFFRSKGCWGLMGVAYVSSLSGMALLLAAVLWLVSLVMDNLLRVDRRALRPPESLSDRDSLVLLLVSGVPELVVLVFNRDAEEDVARAMVCWLVAWWMMMLVVVQ